MNAGFKRLFVGFITVPINTTYHQPHPFICHMKLKKEHFDYKPGKVWLKHSCLQEWHRDETPASVHFHPQQFYIISCIIIIQKKKKIYFFLGFICVCLFFRQSLMMKWHHGAEAVEFLLLVAIPLDQLTTDSNKLFVVKSDVLTFKLSFLGYLDLT